MERLSFDSAIQELAGLDDWLTSLGVDVKKDRWHEAKLMLRRAREQRRELDGGAPLQPIPNYVAGLFELLEILKVFRAFSDDSSTILRGKISRALCGPISPMEESPRNNGARNAMFELVLAANWRNGGAIVELGEPDIRIVLGETNFLVECKRPFSAKGVRRNIEDAAGQLHKALGESAQAGSYGLVAISLSRIFNPGNVLSRAPENMGGVAVQNALIKMIQEHKYEWRWDTTKFHDRVAVVIFHLAVPWEIDGERLIYLETAKAFEQAKCPSGSRVFKENDPLFGDQSPSAVKAVV
jgi:hypothetical protein